MLPDVPAHFWPQSLLGWAGVPSLLAFAWMIGVKAFQLSKSLSRRNGNGSAALSAKIDGGFQATTTGSLDRVCGVLDEQVRELRIIGTSLTALVVSQQRHFEASMAYFAEGRVAMETLRGTPRKGS